MSDAAAPTKPEETKQAPPAAAPAEGEELKSVTLNRDLAERGGAIH